MTLNAYQEVISIYKDIEKELKILKESKSVCEFVLDSMQRFSYGKVSFVTEIDRFKMLVESINDLDCKIKNVEDKLHLVKKCISDVTDIESLVLVKRDIEKKELYKIADETGYSYQYIKEISARLPRTYF